LWRQLPALARRDPKLPRVEPFKTALSADFERIGTSRCATSRDAAEVKAWNVAPIDHRWKQPK
jgi:hypothetical protein